MATWVTPTSASQSDNASRSRVMVPNGWSSMIPSTCCPVGSGVTRQAIMVFLCTSNPAQWVNTTSMAHLLESGGLAGYLTGAILHGVLDFPWEDGDNSWCLWVSRSN